MTPNTPINLTLYGGQVMGNVRLHFTAAEPIFSGPALSSEDAPPPTSFYNCPARSPYPRIAGKPWSIPA